VVDVTASVSGHNDDVAGRTGRLLAFFARAEPRGAAPSGWALAVDAAVAVGAAIGAVYELVTSGVEAQKVIPGGAMSLPLGGGVVLVPAKHIGGLLLTSPVAPHVPYGAVAAAVMTGLPLAARRIYPITAWLAVAAAVIAIHSTFLPPVALGTAIYAAYSAITHSRYRNLAVTMVGVVTITVAGALGNELPRFPGKLTAVFAIVPAAAAGLGIRVLRHKLADSTARLRRAADEARAATERALAAERARIASELHDVVTHNVSVMIVQAGAARKIMASSPSDAEDALLAVEATGRDAMTELRNLLGLLSPAADGVDEAGRCPGEAVRGVSGGMAGGGTGGGGTGGGGTGGDGVFDGVTAGVFGGGSASVCGTDSARTGAGGGPVSAALRPQPGLGELDALIGRVCAAGLPVELAVTGGHRPLPPGADLAAYRVVQEGLTNVLRHAGAATATVTVDWGESLRITVGDDGPGRVGAGAAAPGRGLLGLRERLALYGGELDAGPRPEGGWLLRGVLPLTGPPGPGAGVPGATSPGAGVASAGVASAEVAGATWPGAGVPGVGG
jgi:signal transduction histidine kinase